MGLGDDVTLTLEPSERLTNRGGAHPEQLRHVALTQMRPGLELTGFDHLAQRIGNEIRLALVLDIGGRLSRADPNMIYQPSGTTPDAAT